MTCNLEGIYSQLVARVASFHASRDTNKLYARQKSHVIIIIINTQRPNRTNLFHKEIKIV